MIDQLRNTVHLLTAGAWSDVWSAARTCWRSDSETIGLRRDVSLPFAAPQAAIPITVRELRASDIPVLFANTGNTLSVDALRQRAIRLRMTKANLQTCYVAVTGDDQPCYVQWLIAPSENDNVRAIFGERFPSLKPDEMLLEGAFTLEAWRGKGIMAAAMAQITEKAIDHHAKWVITFVGSDNIPSLKGCKKSGFEPFIGRTDRWRVFQHRSQFGPLAPART
jgi:GNAT superfamily N-acetyltransferase